LKKRGILPQSPRLESPLWGINKRKRSEGRSLNGVNPPVLNVEKKATFLTKGKIGEPNMGEPWLVFTPQLLSQE